MSILYLSLQIDSNIKSLNISISQLQFLIEILSFFDANNSFKSLIFAVSYNLRWDLLATIWINSIIICFKSDIVGSIQQNSILFVPIFIIIFVNPESSFLSSVSVLSSVLSFVSFLSFLSFLSFSLFSLLSFYVN